MLPARCRVRRQEAAYVGRSAPAGAVVEVAEPDGVGVLVMRELPGPMRNTRPVDLEAEAAWVAGVVDDIASSPVTDAMAFAAAEVAAMAERACPGASRRGAASVAATAAPGTVAVMGASGWWGAREDWESAQRAGLPPLPPQLPDAWRVPGTGNVIHHRDLQLHVATRVGSHVGSHVLMWGSRSTVTGLPD